MGTRKGQKHYPESLKLQVLEEFNQGKSMTSLSQRYGVSYWSVHCWCGRSEKVNQRQMMPLNRGRPTNKPEDLEKKVKRLEMENELLRNFLREVERK